VSKLLPLIAVAALFGTACSDMQEMAGPDDQAAGQKILSQRVTPNPQTNATLSANGWYEGDEIYYLLLGIEEGVNRRGDNEIYFIGGDRLHQGNVVLFIPGERGYSPHWNVNVVNTAAGVTVQDIIDAGLASEHFGAEGVLFDDVEDIDAAEAYGLVEIVEPGIVVLCPIVPEVGAEAPGINELPEVFVSFDLGSGF
jgi:hypothetical protein